MPFHRERRQKAISFMSDMLSCDSQLLCGVLNEVLSSMQIKLRLLGQCIYSECHPHGKAVPLFKEEFAFFALLSIVFNFSNRIYTFVVIL